MSAPAPEISGTPRRAAVAEGTGVPVDGHDAYRRGLCRDCFTAWHSAGRTRCDACHAIYAAHGGREAAPLKVVSRGAGGGGPWRPRATLNLVKTA